MLRPGPLAKGLLSFPFERFRNPHSDSGPGTPDIAYSRFLRFLKLYNSAISGAGLPRVVAELGPGSSLGFGLAALIAGSERYYALDLIQHSSTERNLAVFDALVALFKNRTAVPNGGWCAHIFPFVEDFHFPADILGRQALDKALAPIRLSEIRRDLEAQSGNIIQYIVPWQERVVDLKEKPDWIVSNSVLEHVDDIESTYRSFAALSKSGTVMCHSIDYSSHLMTTAWNEHWKIDDALWGLLRGKRHYLINRLPNEEHLACLKKYDFKLVDQQKLRRVDGLLREEFAKKFHGMKAEDAATHLSFQVSRFEPR